MNISKENTGDLTAIITIELTKEDYEDKVNKSLKEQQKKANMPGFRPGKVPFGMIKKIYGRAVLADEINNQLGENLTKYITDNEFSVLGNPLPSEEKETNVDFEHDTDFVFHFDIGLTPEFDIELSDNIEVDYYEIDIDKEMEDKYIKDLRQRFGTHEHPETIEDKDVVKGEMIELDDNGEEKEDGIKHSASIATDLIKNEEDKAKFVGAGNDDTIVFNPMKATENATETSLMLGISKEEAEKIESEFKFVVDEITRHKPADLNEEFFKKVFGEEVDSEEKFNEKLKEVIGNSFTPDTDRFFMNMAIEKLIDQAELQLPDSFLKRLLKEGEGEQKVTDEQIETQYENYAKSVKWQLIEGKIIKDNDIKVEENEIRDVVRNYFTSQMMYDENDQEAVERMEGLIDTVLQNKEESTKIHNQLFDTKVNDLFKSTLKLNKKQVSYNEFSKLVSELNN